MAASGYAAFSLAMACARLNGRRLIVRYGDTVVLVSGALLAAAGMLAGALAPPHLALVGFVLVGLGLANVFPLAIANAGLLGGPSGVARASTVGYTGLLGGPPMIGFLAGAWVCPWRCCRCRSSRPSPGCSACTAAPQRALLHARVSGWSTPAGSGPSPG